MLKSFNQISICIFSCLLASMLSACEYYPCVNGKVFDKETGKPLKGATVELLEGKEVGKTDSEGYYYLCTSSNARIRQLSVKVTMDGYKPFQLKEKFDDDETSYIVKSETVFADQNGNITNYEKWSDDFYAGDTLKIYLTKE